MMDIEPLINMGEYEKNFKHYMGHSWSGNIGPVVWILEFGSLAWGYLLDSSNHTVCSFKTQWHVNKH